MQKALLIIIPVLLAIAGFNQMNKSSAVTPVPLHVTSLHMGWMKSYNKVYASPEERNFRLGIFHETYVMVTEHNANPDATYTMELNQFADMTDEEIRAKYLMGDFTQEDQDFLQAQPRLTAEDAPRPEGVRGNPDVKDWRTEGVVPPVLNQGRCGSCWAFASAAMAEATYNILNEGDEIKQFSPQQVLDCSGGGSCKGGFPHKTFDMYSEPGATSNDFYAYKGEQGYCDTGKIIEPSKLFTENGMVSANEQAFETWSSVRVLGIGIMISRNFMMYKEGIFNDMKCADEKIGGHAITLNGYNNNEGWWLVRNSWGDRWGEDGYVRMLKNPEGICDFYNYGLAMH